MREGTFEVAESTVQQGVEWLRLVVESIGVLVIALGLVAAMVQFLRDLRERDPRAYVDLRLTLARYLALALEFQLASDILSTAIAPTWDQIGKLAAVAVIRTFLNFFLEKEMRVEEDEMRRPPTDFQRKRREPLS